MKKLLLGLLATTIVAAPAFVLGRATALPRAVGLAVPGPTSTVTVSPSPSPTLARDPWLYRDADRSKRWILQWFAEAEEEQLPVQGILGGDVRPWTVVFPDGFTGKNGDRYYVAGSDGHFGHWWVYRGNRVAESELVCPTVGSKPTGCPGSKFGDELDRLVRQGFEVWNLLPSYYVRYQREWDPERV